MTADKMSSMLKLIADRLEDALRLATPEATKSVVNFVDQLAVDWLEKRADGTVADLVEFARRWSDKSFLLRVISLFKEHFKQPPDGN